MSEQQSHSGEIENDVCRRQQPDSYPPRLYVPDEAVSWSIVWPEYTPSDHDLPRALTDKAKEGDYADPQYPWEIDWSKRSSFVGDGKIHFDAQGYPLNPVGRTGIEGRGMLNAWGPTKAVDAIITRDGPNGETQMLVITRSDNGSLANIGGKFNVNSSNEVIEQVLDAANRETEEEGGIDLDFSKARMIRKGYVDDERNTDNAWMETIVLHLHLSEEEAEALVLQAQEEDVSDAQWVPVNDENLAALNASGEHDTRMALGL